MKHLFHYSYSMHSWYVQLCEYCAKPATQACVSIIQGLIYTSHNIKPFIYTMYYCIAWSPQPVLYFPGHTFASCRLNYVWWSQNIAQLFTHFSFRDMWRKKPKDFNVYLLTKAKLLIKVILLHIYRSLNRTWDSWQCLTKVSVSRNSQ